MTEPTEDGGRNHVASVSRAFRIIETLEAEGPLQIPAIAAALEMPESTIHVHLQTLQAVGYVVHDSSGYDLGLRFLETGVSARERRDVYSIARTELDDLAQATGEVSNLGVEEQGSRIILYQAEGSDAVYDNAPVGEHTHMHWTALGKAILAEQPTKTVDEILDTHGLPTATENTITGREELHSTLETIRDRGYALEDEERRAGIRSVAVPLMVESDVIGAISLSGPKERFTTDRIETDLVPALQNTSNVIEIRYSYD